MVINLSKDYEERLFGDDAILRRIEFCRIEDVLGLTRGAIDASSHAPLKLRPVGDGAMAPRKLNLGLERALTELLRSALRDKRVSNSAAIRLIGEIVRL